jgi:membrane protein DedA with SNARE-associated domain
MLERLVDILGGHSLQVGYGFVFLVLVLCGFGLPVPEDVILVTGGVLAWIDCDLEVATIGGMIRDPGLIAMVCVGLAGILAGDSVIFFMGRRLGAHVAEIRPLRRMVPPEKLERVEKLIRRRGKVVVAIARFLPGLRAPTFFAVGHARLPYWEFLFIDGLAALVSAPLWVCIGFFFGANIEEAARTAARFSHFTLLAVFVVLGVLLFRWLQGRRAAQAQAASGGERD